MAGISSIRRLPKEVREMIHSWFDQGATVDQVTEHLRNMGAPVSRSAVGRHRKEWGEVIAQVRESREAAEVLARTFRDAPASEMAQANIEMLHTLMQRLLRAAVTEEEIRLKPSEIMHLTKSISNLTGARKSEVDTTVTAEKAVQENIQEDADGASKTIEIRFVDPPRGKKSKKPVKMEES